MTRVEELKKKITELRESGAEPEDISQVVQELNMELAKAHMPDAVSGGGKAIRKKKKVVSND